MSECEQERWHRVGDACAFPSVSSAARLEATSKLLEVVTAKHSWKDICLSPWKPVGHGDSRHAKLCSVRVRQFLYLVSKWKSGGMTLN